jgi:hypothetical protein
MTKRAQPGPVQARKHGASALRLWRRHKARAAMMAALALACLAMWAAPRAAVAVRTAVRNLRQGRERNQ